MGTSNGVDLETFGVWTFDFEDQPAALLRESVRELEELGWRAIWIPELLGREAFSQAGYLLSATERVKVINGIARISARGAFWAHGASTLLADAYPGRYVLGLGFGGPGERPGITPMAAMNAYLDELDAATTPNPAPQVPAPRILAAHGPRMLALARDRSAGAHCYKVNVAHTEQSREILGPGAFLGVEHAVLFETDPARARAVAREHLAPYLTAQYNVAKFRRLGYSERDLSDSGSDRFVDDLVFWGGLDTITEKLRGHLAAGADHVAIQVIGIKRGQTAMPYWRMLAGALLPQGVSA